MSDDVFVKINVQMLKTIDFNKDILGIERRTPGLQEPDEFKLSLHQLREEIDELELAYKHQDFLGVLDALIDLEYFMYGVFWKCGIPEHLHSELFAAVHSANMMKKRGVKAGREGYDAADANKPESWTDPTLLFARILENGK